MKIKVTDFLTSVLTNTSFKCQISHIYSIPLFINFLFRINFGYFLCEYEKKKNQIHEEMIKNGSFSSLVFNKRMCLKSFVFGCLMTLLILWLFDLCCWCFFFFVSNITYGMYSLATTITNISCTFCFAPKFCFGFFSFFSFLFFFFCYDYYLVVVVWCSVYRFSFNNVLWSDHLTVRAIREP